MAFCAAIATAVVIGACGSDIPGNAVAQVGDASITTAALNHWLVVANNSNQVRTGVAAPPLPVPPDYTACIAGQRKQASSATASTSTLKALCAQNYQALLTQVLNYLIQTIWIQGEAIDRGVSVTPAQVEKSYVQQRKLSTPPLTTPAALKSFLAKSGQTVTDLVWRTRLNLLVNDIEAKVQTNAGKVTPAQIAAYYKKNRALYITPETRNLHLVETSSQATAAKVRSLLAGGSSYATVAPKYSIDPTTKAAGGKMLGVSPSELNAQLSAAVFAAKAGKLSGPVKTAFGYYVFTVDAITPSSLQSLKTATPTIKTLLAQQQVTKAEAALQTDFSKKWTARTNCRSGYVVAPSCSNAPKTATGSTSTGAAGAATATG
jgi:foldase protein PrsA